MEETSHDTQLAIADEGAYDKQNPKSHYNLLPKSMQDALLRTKKSFLNDLSPESGFIIDFNSQSSVEA